MNKEINIPFYNDLLFKYFVYNNEDQDCMYLLKTIIETVTPIRCKELHVMNSELIPSRYGEKKSILDVRVQTEEGEFINIEVQSQGIFESLHKRFQFYVFKNIASQIESGDDYRKLQPVYQIVLFNDEDQEHHELIREYASLDKKYHDDQGSLYHVYYIFLKEIDRIIEEKGKDNLDDLEELSYLIEKGSKCDRINLTKVGRIMKNKYDKFMEDMNLREEAWAYEKAEFDKKAHYYDGEAKGERNKAKSQVMKFYQKKYPNEDARWLENLTEKQYDEILELIFENKGLDEIKQVIGK
ncbi:Rpn family recombination-promoting nuclease/putative transposase [Faecalibacillus faecis]|uniref:Rpn family recombination-promoting nuclease/putative transposase n=1 Tax=Faecalibacillus faecis TaxID=1982628 RepID=UPI0038631A19